jgi:hypothetical protein
VPVIDAQGRQRAEAGGPDMTPYRLEAFRILILMLGIVGLIFWRTAFKIIIGALVALIALMAIAFMLGFLQGMSHFL